MDKYFIQHIKPPPIFVRFSRNILYAWNQQSTTLIGSFYLREISLLWRDQEKLQCNLAEIYYDR